MLNKKLYRLFFVSLTVITPALNAVPAPAALSITFSAELMRDPIAIPPIVDSIDGTQDGAILSGQSETRGTGGVRFVPDETGATFNLVIDTSTQLTVNATANPLKKLEVVVKANGVTRMQSIKRLTFLPTGLNAQPTVSTAVTTMNLNEVDTCASGIARWFENFAQKKGAKQFCQTKAKSEQTTSQQAVDKINKTVDEQFGTLANGLNRDYLNVLYDPMFLSGKIPGNLSVTSSAEEFSFGVVPNEPLGHQAALQIPRLPQKSAVGLRLHESLFNQYVDKLTRPGVYNEEDLEEFFITNGIPAQLAFYHDAEPQIQLTFCDTNALTAAFTEHFAYFKLCAKDVKFVGHAASHIEILLAYGVGVSSDQQIQFKRSADFLVRSATHEPLAKAFHDTIKTRFNRFFPTEMKMGKNIFPAIGMHAQKLIVNGAASGGGWLMASWGT